MSKEDKTVQKKEVKKEISQKPQSNYDLGQLLQQVMPDYIQSFMQQGQYGMLITPQYIMLIPTYGSTIDDSIGSMQQMPYTDKGASYGKPQMPHQSRGYGGIEQMAATTYKQ